MKQLKRSGDPVGRLLRQKYAKVPTNSAEDPDSCDDLVLLGSAKTAVRLLYSSLAKSLFGFNGFAKQTC